MSYLIQHNLVILTLKYKFEKFAIKLSLMSSVNKDTIERLQRIQLKNVGVGKVHYRWPYEN